MPCKWRCGRKTRWVCSVSNKKSTARHRERIHNFARKAKKNPKKTPKKHKKKHFFLTCSHSFSLTLTRKFISKKKSMPTIRTIFTLHIPTAFQWAQFYCTHSFLCCPFRSLKNRGLKKSLFFTDFEAYFELEKSKVNTKKSDGAP